jgi:hypothetical protein
VAVTRGEGQRAYWASEDTYVVQVTLRGPHVGAPAHNQTL